MTLLSGLRIRHGWTVVLVALVTTPVSSPAGESETRPNASAVGARSWKTVEPMPIEVRDGKATFRAPTDGASGELLVVVSSLSRSSGPYQVELEARAVDEASPLRLADDGPVHSPALSPFHPSPVPPASTKIPASERRFHMMVRDGDVGSASNYLAVKGVLRAIGDRVQVYVAEEDVGRVSPSLLTELVSTFDEHIHPVAARSIGLAEDVDDDGRFTILVSSWLSRLGDGRNAVDGYVRVTDLDKAYPAPFGNRCDMMYLSAALQPGPHLRTVMAHEYTHAVMFTQKSLRQPAGVGAAVEEEGWLDEAVAHLVEDLHGFGRSNLAYRVSAFLSQPERYQLVVDDYYAADLFRSHGNRGSTYLFLRWCVDRYGPDLLPTLIGSRLRGTANLEAATGRSFADLYRRWSFDLYMRGLQPKAALKSVAVSGSRLNSPAAAPEDWLLAGPHSTRVVVDQEPDSWSMTGTSSRFVVIDGGNAKTVEVSVQASDSAQLQVTAALLPRDTARVTLAARAYVGLDGDLMLRTTVREHKGQSVRLLGLGWEPLIPPPDANRANQRPGRLDTEGLVASFGRTSLAGGSSLHSRPIRLPGVAQHSGPLVLKLVGVDDRGRQVSAWAALNQDDDDDGPDPLPLAGDRRADPDLDLRSRR